MEYILRRIHKAGIFGWLYVLTLFHAFHFFAIHYVHSSFLEQFLSQTGVGFMFAASSALSLVVLFSVAIFLAKFGNYRVILFSVLLDFAVSLGLAYTHNIGWLFVFFVMNMVLVPVTLFCLDIFLENYTRDENTTGAIRGTFLSISNFASLIAPIISGWILGPESLFGKVYLIGALYLVPVAFILVARFRNFVDPVYDVLSPQKMLNLLRTDKNILNISSAQFLLRFYFSWMVVYLPIYLHEYMGFSWLDVGIILFIMLIPYVLIEYPAGVIADRYLGEKELLIVGFLVTVVPTAFLFSVDSKNIMVWGGLLFITRIGAALIESMTETYFFKKIDGDDPSILSIFRMLRPLAYTVGPITAGVLLLYVNMATLWLILAGITFFGIFNALALDDTR